MKVALVTGGSRGIGACLCECLANMGYAVVIDYKKSTDKAEALASKINKNNGVAFAYQCDVSKPDLVRKMFEFIKNQFGHLDVLINNAGISGGFNTITNITDENWQDVVGTNLSGMFYCCREAVRLMLPRKSGKIINLSSMWGIKGASCESHYSATKSGIIGLTKALAQELAPSGITVNSIAPGSIATDMMAELPDDEYDDYIATIPLGYIAKTDEMSKLMQYILTADYLTGQVISPNGGVVI